MECSISPSIREEEDEESNGSGEAYSELADVGGSAAKGSAVASGQGDAVEDARRASNEARRSEATSRGRGDSGEEVRRGEAQSRGRGMPSQGGYVAFGDYVQSEFNVLIPRLCAAHEAFCGQPATSIDQASTPRLDALVKVPTVTKAASKWKRSVTSPSLAHSGTAQSGNSTPSSSLESRMALEHHHHASVRHCSTVSSMYSSVAPISPTSGRQKSFHLDLAALNTPGELSAEQQHSLVAADAPEKQAQLEVPDGMSQYQGTPSMQSFAANDPWGTRNSDASQSQQNSDGNNPKFMQNNDSLFDEFCARRSDGWDQSLSTNHCDRGSQPPKQKSSRKMYVVDQIWKDSLRVQNHHLQSHRTSLHSYMSNSESFGLHEEKANCIDMVLQRFVVQPNSARRLCWDLLALVFVTWESIMIPLEFLDLPESGFLVSMAWIGRFFWTFDLPLSLLTGYNLAAGRQELRPRRVMKQYLKTWFFIDSSMLAVDWIEVFVGAFGGINAARMGKTVKSLRMMRMGRMLRLFRLSNVPDFVKFIAYKAAWFYRSEICIIVLSLFKIMIFVIWINHAIACCWYGLAYEEVVAVDDGTAPDINWLSEHKMMDQSLYYRYTTSFHWSLTQFAGSMEVAPENGGERTYAIIVLLLAFMMSATIVSRITSSMTRLEIATAQRYQKMQSLESYLFENSISRKLALRVQRNALFALEEEKRNTPESSIELLQIVSQPLRIELHFEMHMPILSTHPLLRNYVKLNEAAMHAVCNEAVFKRALMQGDTAFHEGEMAAIPMMYFVVQGRLVYKQDLESFSVFPSDWACEANLWTSWLHVGTLRCKTQATLLLLNAEIFQAVCGRFPDGDGLLAKYAHGFVERLNSSLTSELTDLKDETMELEDLAERCCPQPTNKLRKTVAGDKDLPEPTSGVDSLGTGTFNARRRHALKHNIQNFNGVLSHDSHMESRLSKDVYS